MKTTIINLALASTVGSVDTFANAGRQVGRRDARRANVYAVKKDVSDDVSLATTFGNELPNPFAILLGSVRWSVTRSEYVVSTNNFVDYGDATHIFDSMTEGVQAGVEEYDEANATIDALEGLDKRILARLISSVENSAWFANDVDANLWGTKTALGVLPFEVTYYSFETGNDFVHRLVGIHAKTTGETIDGVWKVEILAPSATEEATI